MSIDAGDVLSIDVSSVSSVDTLGKPEISSPRLFVSDISDFTFGTSPPRFAGIASSIDILQ
ncbi:hypothetical protein F2Q68_00039615 [Brassica cretica]|uniref:Uncharacterized protein n=1 Tax=Brassica cretica TaxID=69181 RepID=A0A8S9MH30_BRACR|nr:hypothetical protein F2Q68_00039615 [Brassica cretica]